MDKFKFKIKELRLSRNISQQQLANDLNVSKQAVSKWEKGHSLPDIASVEMIAAYFGVSTDYLLNDGIEVATNHYGNASNNGVEVVTNQSDNANAENSGRKGFCASLTKKEKWILLSAVSFLLVLVIVLSICLGISEDERKKNSFTPTKVSVNGLEVTGMSYSADRDGIEVFVYVQNVTEKDIEFSPYEAHAIDREDCYLSIVNGTHFLKAGKGWKYSVLIMPSSEYGRGRVTLYCFGSPIIKCKFKSQISLI